MDEEMDGRGRARMLRGEDHEEAKKRKRLAYHTFWGLHPVPLVLS